MLNFTKSAILILLSGFLLLSTAIGLSSCSYNDFVYSFVDIIQLGMWLSDVPEPEIKYAEFPFTLIYEIDGETIELHDSIVCEFDGFRVAGGKLRKWKIYLKSKPDQVDEESSSLKITLLDLSGSNDQDQFGNTLLELYFYGGKAEYYMGDDLRGMSGEGKVGDIVEYMAVEPDGSLWSGTFSAEEAMEKYKIRLLSWEVAEPIINNFIY